MRLGVNFYTNGDKDLDPLSRLLHRVAEAVLKGSQ